ncbi:MAG: HD domain-containing protein [Candidatus Gracilibacteria bacterium]|nr:HD domain-containing protein [Candidatus Gracilibacteria bacterium]
MYGGLTEKFEQIVSSLDVEKKVFLESVYDFAYDSHLGQKRKSGEDYFIHPLAVAIELHRKFGDLELTCAGLLHDTVEDNPETLIEHIYEQFGDKIGYLVDSVTKNEETFYKQEKKFKYPIDKILDGGMKDIRCILLKLADRNHNLETLEHIPELKQVKISFESQALYIPLLGILEYNNSGLKQAKENFLIYLKENDIVLVSDLKKDLLNHSFHDFNEDLYNMVSKHPENVLWSINDFDMYKTFILSLSEETISTKSIYIDETGKFEAMIRYTNNISTESIWKLGINTSYFK